MMTEPYTADDRQAALILWKSASRRMSGYETAICQKIAENFPVSKASFARFLELKSEFSEYLNQNAPVEPRRAAD